MTPDIKVAEAYAKGTVFKSRSSRTLIGYNPTVVTCSVSSLKVFDFRIAKCVDLYEVIRKAWNVEHSKDPDALLPKITSPGFISSHSGFPGYGYIKAMASGIRKLGYDAVYVDEGSQGISMFVWNTIKVKVLGTIKVLQ